MSDLTGRLYNVAKAYLGAAKERISEIDAQAQDELSRALTRDDVPGQASGVGSMSGQYSSDPLERARAKIAAAQSQAAAQRDTAPVAPSPSAAEATPSPTTDPVQTAYKVLGVPPGSDYLAVQAAVSRLRERCDPARFPEGSDERDEATVILAKVEEAHQVLRLALNAGAGRFDKLEI